MNAEMFSKRSEISYGKVSFAVITVIFLCFLLRNFIISQMPLQYFSGNDSGAHLYELLKIENSLSLSDNLDDFFLHLGNSFKYLYFDIRRPPVFYLVSLFLNLFIRNMFVVSMYLLPLIFFAITIIFTFKTSELLCKRSGIFSVLVLSLFPGIIKLNTGISLYPGQNAFAVCVFYFFFKSGFFKNRKYSFLCALAFCLGLLTKEQFPLIFIGSFLLLGALILAKKISIDFKNLELAALTVVILGFLPFYIFQIKTYVLHEPFIPRLHNFSYQAFYYIKALFDNMGIPLGILFLAAGAAHLVKRKVYAWFFLLSWLCFVLICSLYKVLGGSSFQWYYSSVFCPLFAVLIGIFLAWQRRMIRQLILIVLLITHAIANFPGRFEWPCYRASYTYNIRDYINTLSRNTFLQKSRKELRIGILRDSWECTLPAELELFLRIDGYRQITGGNGYPNIELFLCRENFDIFIYVTKEESLFWPNILLLKQQVDSLLPELKEKITKDDIMYLFNRQDDLNFVVTMPYFITHGEKMYHVRVYINKI